MLTESLLAYDEEGNVIGTLDHLVRRQPDGTKVLVDFAQLEADDRPLDSAEGGVWHVDRAAGSKVWPQRISRPHRYRVEKEGPPGHKRISALMHRKTRRKHKRAELEKAIERRLAEATEAAGGTLRVTPDEYVELLKDIVGSPTEPLDLDPE